ncbi:hypothetical protein [Bacillus cereus]|uniref:hypothetical protein n=1 Tax=Bacillus cereus TaxID=1396 RepID=UPI0018CE9F85|nr:hypothetical protein [Bacillus cereus]
MPDCLCCVCDFASIHTGSGAKKYRIDAGTVITRSHTKEEDHFADFNQRIYKYTISTIRL